MQSRHLLTLATTAPESFRRLAWDELVKRGDFVENGNQGFEPWVGPSGFHAGTFIRTIYRKLSHSTKAGRKTT